MFLKLQKVLVSASRTHIHKNVAFFAKEAPKKDGKKDDKAAPVAVIEEVPLSTLATQLIAPNHPSLSPSELKYSLLYAATITKALPTCPRVTNSC
jgi:hypothetical protein